uniref:Uncharacterized protein n=1 Tax=Anguilla anguilla TaxID=7936 RepID=A0A0E9UTD0_ANGAN
MTASVFKKSHTSSSYFAVKTTDKTLL